jgi:hypothetical protein
VVLNVSLLDVEVVEAVSGASVEAAHEVEIGRLSGLVSDVDNEWTECAVDPMVFMICADLVGKTSTSLRVTGGKSALKTEWKEMYTRSR